MVAAAFPVAKLGFLLIKQVAKPIAKSLAARARNYRIFREYLCIPVAQIFHWYEIKLKMQMMNVGGKVTKVPKLNEAKAIEQGSEILSEFMILSIASAILIFEYTRQKEKEEVKEGVLAAERERIKNKIFELEFKVEKQTTQIRELARTVIHIEEDIHKRSLRRIFESKPKVSQEILESAQESPSTKVFLVQPLEDDSIGAPPKEIKALPSIEAKKESDATAEEMVEKKPVKKPGLVLSAVQDILDRK